MKIAITYDEGIRQRKKMFRKVKIQYRRVVKEFDGDLNGLEKAIEFAFRVDTNTPYFLIEQVYTDSREEVSISYLIAQLKYSAKSVALKEERERLEAKQTEQAIRDEVARRVKSDMKFFLENVADRVRKEIAEEIKNFEIDG